MMKSISTLIALALLSLVSGRADAQPAGYAPAGSLNCNMAPSVGMVIAGVKEMSCIFTPVQGPLERYTGRITTVGVDIGITTGGAFGWTVLMAGATFYPPASLGGKYVGASADASVVVGGGANVLFGGNNRAFALQPLSAQAQAGLNLSAGLAGLELFYVPQ